jgi:HTH-type transcriptional regulator/antitoxin HigA
VLATLVEAYEQKHFPVNAADPVEAILFRMEQQGLERSDLEAYLGSRHRVSEVLNRKRGLSLDMIRRLHEGLGIPLEALVGEAA